MDFKNKFKKCIKFIIFNFFKVLGREPLGQTQGFLSHTAASANPTSPPATSGSWQRNKLYEHAEQAMHAQKAYFFRGAACEALGSSQGFARIRVAYF